MFEKMFDQAVAWVFDAGINLLVALIILLVGLKVIKKVRGILDHTMEKAGVETTLRRFLNALVYVLMVGILVFVVAGEVGIEVTSLVALVGSVGLALSLAMEKSLANFAGGVMVLLLKPFKVGDFISTPDNQKINIPNSNMTTSVVTNVTAADKRKVVLSVGIGYAADLKKAKAVAERVLENNEFIINEDGLQVVVAELGESSVNLSVRGWTKTETYWDAYFSVLEEIKLAFDAEGIEIPFNYLNVNVINNQ